MNENLLCVFANPIAALALGISSIVAPLAHAVPEDADAPIHLKGDEVEGNMTERTIVRGSVQMDQGTLRVEADSMVIDWVDGDVVRITAEGDRAHFQQRVRPGDPPVKADARVIVYHRTEERIELKGEAYLNQLDNEFRGEKIDYNMRKGQVDAKSAEPGGVEIIWQPAKSSAGRRSGE